MGGVYLSLRLRGLRKFSRPAMALLRPLYSSPVTVFRANHLREPSISLLSSSQNSLCVPDNGAGYLSISRPPLAGSYSSNFSLGNGRMSKFVFHFSLTSEEKALDSSSVDVRDGLESEIEEFSRTRLIAQNLPWTCTHEDIRALFEKYGTVQDVELSMYNKTKNRGLAFVSMGSAEEALNALNNMESYEFEGRTLNVAYAKPKKKKPVPTVQPKPVTFNLFVANLPYGARAKDLREFFESGSNNVVSAQIIFHENPKRSLGYGFVAFKSRKDAEAALSEFQGKDFMGRPLRVARGKQFVKAPTEEKPQSETTSTNDVIGNIDEA